MRIKTLQGTWDKRQGRGKYIGDQTYIELEIDSKLSELQGEDSRIPHDCNGKPFDFWVHNYPSVSLISFIHHNSENLLNCDNKPVGHKDHNFCGFAGGTFEYIVDGVTYKVVGGWSSNNNHYNRITGKDYTDCAVYEPNHLSGRGLLYIPVANLIEMISKQKLPYKLVRGLGVDLNSIEAVHEDDLEQFISRAGMWNPESYSNTGTRWASQYSDIEGPSKYRTRYIKDDIKNVQVLN